MDICIIGTGASGWIACTILKKLKFIKKITIIGSSKIPTIGVGESTTLSFTNNVLYELDLKEFVRQSGATIKYGVYYKNWSKRDFLHYFTHEVDEKWENVVSLGNKESDTHIHELRGNKIWNFVKENHVAVDSEDYDRNHAWHFDAGKFIQFLKNHNLKDEKVEFIDDKIIDCKFSGDQLEFVVGESNKKYKSDYFVNCCGDNDLNQKVFKEEYESLSQYLLTNKAVVYPPEYSNKREQFHPYTVTKTMNCGWRWIIPTQSRIGTGYVFSDNHISVDEATDEFLSDLGDKTITPSVIDFSPRYNKRTFKTNSCTIGMSNGFLEPLDASGLSMTIDTINFLIPLLRSKYKKSGNYVRAIELTNNNQKFLIKSWVSFVLHQYKTCCRNDTQFWLDHKNIECNFYDQICEMTFKKLPQAKEYYSFLYDLHLDAPSLFLSTAARDIQWNTYIEKPMPIELPDVETMHHLDYIEKFYGSGLTSVG